MNVEKEGDYVDLSTDKTPHYGVVTRVIDSNSWYYTLTKNKKVKQVICGAYVNGVKNGNVQYKCLYNKKKISLKKWKQITDKWIKQTSTLKYYRNTTSNRKKHMKM